VREALATLPWVEKESIEADVPSRKVTFHITDASKFDFEQLNEALKKQDFDDAQLIHGPTARAAEKKS
jgi:hypothetical protein